MNSDDYHSITTSVAARLAGQFADSVPVGVDLAWSAADPLAVHVTINQPHAPKAIAEVTWAVAREMLIHGMSRPIVPEHGDVAVFPWCPFPKMMLIRFDVGGYSAGLLIDRQDMAMFLDCTLRVTPLGQERVAIDAALAQLLDEEAAS